MVVINYPIIGVIVVPLSLSKHGFYSERNGTDLSRYGLFLEETRRQGCIYGVFRKKPPVSAGRLPDDSC